MHGSDCVNLYSHKYVTEHVVYEIATKCERGYAFLVKCKIVFCDALINTLPGLMVFCLTQRAF